MVPCGGWEADIGRPDGDGPHRLPHRERRRIVNAVLAPATGTGRRCETGRPRPGDWNRRGVRCQLRFGRHRGQRESRGGEATARRGPAVGRGLRGSGKRGSRTHCPGSRTPPYGRGRSEMAEVFLPVHTPTPPIWGRSHPPQRPRGRHHKIQCPRVAR